MLAGLACIDIVVFFDEPIPEVLIRELEPTALANGGRKQADRIVGVGFIIPCGGQVVMMSLVPGPSATNILERRRGA